MSVAYTILGVLMAAPAHGYSIRKQLEETFSNDYGLNDGQLYPALAKLESLGWIEKEVVEQQRSPTKHLYRVTPEGSKAFASWLEGSQAPGTRERQSFFWRDEFLQRASFFGHLAPAEAAEQIRSRLAQTEARAARLEARVAERRGGEADPYRRMIVEYGVRLQRMRREWLEELLARATEAPGLRTDGHQNGRRNVRQRG
ncbi:MAG TPA: PadR family transcriptional regulator [Myxococcota bacterium]|nr:PadR family transcriptional regulator [Myxococcota bacterium]